MTDHVIRSEQELLALFEPAGEAALRKEVDHIHPVYRQWIEASPFAVLATAGPGGLDVSPRGDPAPLLRVIDERTILLPERRGNNRVDGLRNILSDPRVSLLLFVPGVGETLRVNGRASVSVDPQWLRWFVVGETLPKCVLRIDVEAVFFQCARAVLRSSLWHCAQDSPKVPTAGDMLAAVSNHAAGGRDYDRELPQRLRSTLY
jgi:uncharacterized protein